MGSVYEGYDPRLQRSVAIKLLHASPTESDLERFRREACAFARLDHPGIVHIYEVNVQDGRWYMVLDLLERGSLQDQLRREGPFASRAAAALALGLSEALQHAHDHGVLHRDVKPGNVLLSKAGEPLLTDFGLVKELRSVDGLTETGEILGTPAFMAPEQALGEAVDVRSDVYGLGATLYAALTGRPPFTGGAPLRVLNDVVSKQPLRPSELAPVDPALERICLKCLAKRPEDRFGSAVELGMALERYLDGDANLRPTWGRRPWRVGARFVGLSASLLMAVTVAATGTLVLAGGNEPARTTGEWPQALAETDARVEPTRGVERDGEPLDPPWSEPAAGATGGSSGSTDRGAPQPTDRLAREYTLPPRSQNVVSSWPSRQAVESPEEFRPQRSAGGYRWQSLLRTQGAYVSLLASGAEGELLAGSAPASLASQDGTSWVHQRFASQSAVTGAVNLGGQVYVAHEPGRGLGMIYRGGGTTWFPSLVTRDRRVRLARLGEELYAVLGGPGSPLTVRRLQPASGEWRVVAALDERREPTAVVAHRNRLWIACANGSSVALFSGSGDSWNRVAVRGLPNPAPGERLTVPVMASRGEHLYLCTRLEDLASDWTVEGALYRLDGVQLEQLARVDEQEMTALAFADGTVYVGTEGGRLHYLRGGSLEEDESFLLVASIRSMHVGADGQLLVGVEGHQGGEVLRRLPRESR